MLTHAQRKQYIYYFITACRVDRFALQCDTIHSIFLLVAIINPNNRTHEKTTVLVLGINKLTCIWI